MMTKHFEKLLPPPYIPLWMSKKVASPPYPRPVVQYNFCTACGTLVEGGGGKTVCHTCEFWQGIILQQANNKRCFVAGGLSYYIGRENVSESNKGMGGSIWCVAFDDGRKIVTSNLWTNGVIPARYLGHLPDTATLTLKYRAQEMDVSQFVYLPDMGEADDECDSR